MGYQITWKSKDILEDVKSKYKTNFTNKEKIETRIYETRIDILITCMRVNRESAFSINLSLFCALNIQRTKEGRRGETFI